VSWSKRNGRVIIGLGLRTRGIDRGGDISLQGREMGSSNKKKVRKEKRDQRRGYEAETGGREIWAKYTSITATSEQRKEQEKVSGNQEGRRSVGESIS